MTIQTAAHWRGSMALAILAVVLGGCSSGVPVPESAAPTKPHSPSASVASESIVPSPPATTKTSNPPDRPAAGKVTLITTQKGYVDEAQAHRGDGVFAGGFVRTDAGGSLQFNLEQKIERCTLRPRTKVDIKPADDVLLHFETGNAACVTTADPGTVTVTAGTNVEIRMSDPLFVVTVEPGSTRIRVVSGLVEVKSTETGIVTFLGPSNRADIFPGGGPTDPETWGTAELDRPLQKVVDEERKLLPAIDFSMPKPGKSPVLNRIVDAGTINIGLDERVFGDQPSRDFANWLNEFQTDRWRIGQTEPPVLPIQAGVDSLRKGAIDLFVSPDQVDGFGQIPFFDDGQGVRVWLLYDPADEAFGDAERTFLRNAVTRGTYGGKYRTIFGSEAPYSAVADLFGLTN
jgi:hypothetical protein